MTEKTLTTENIRPALDALRGELAPWPVVAKKQDRLNTAQLNAANSGITSSLVAQIIANTAAIRALESAITGTGLRALVVASLPAVGTTGILYIVPVTTYDPDTDADVVNYSNEYIWIVAPDAPVTEGYYEQVGQTGIVINNGQLNITVNGTSVGTFTANQSGDTTAAITVPTNADYVDRTTDQTVAGKKTWTGEQSFTLPIVGSITGTASKAIADEDGTSIKTGYVNVAGNQTVSGQKTWSGNAFFTSGVYHRNNSYEIGNIPTSNVAITHNFADKNNVYTGFARSVIYASGRTATEIRAKNAFKNGVLDPTGADISSNLNVEVQPNGTKTIYWDGLIRNDVTPYTTNNNSLGSSTNQWSSVYAQSYYYNGTAWGLDKSNTWTGSNTYTDSILSKIDSSALAYFKDIYQCQNEAGYRVATFRVTHSNSSRILSINVHDNNNSAPKGIAISNDGNNNINLSAIGTTNSLGTSTNKWKTLNGVNPGALSLPNLDSDGYVDLSSSLTENVQYTYTPAVDGWLALYCQTTGFHAENAVGIFNGAGSSYRWACSATSAINLPRGTTYHGAVMLPVKAGIPYLCWVTINNSTTLSSKRLYFYKALGNV